MASTSPLSSIQTREAGARPARPLLNPALPAATTELVGLERIDCTDRRFQLRVAEHCDDLVASLRRDGQQMPVILWGRTKPYKIIDGFRRIQAMERIGNRSVLAIVREDLDQTQAFGLGFLYNAKRRNLGPEDRAHAIQVAHTEWGMSKSLIGRAFDLSIRQIDRYLRTFDFAPVLRDALAEGRISMAHAVLLHRARVDDPSAWVKRIVAEDLSSPVLQDELRKKSPKGVRRLFVREAKGFRLHPIRFRTGMSDFERSQIKEALELALSLLRAASG